MKTMRIFTTCHNLKLAEQKPVTFVSDLKAESQIVNLYPDVSYQTILGFGGAFTDASAYNYCHMSKKSQAKLIRAYFDRETGLGYNMCRMHIGSCDFTVKEYAYTRKADKNLTQFDLGNDRKYILPMIKDALKLTGEELTLIASPWSPPAWMKTNKQTLHGGKLSPEYYGTWAKYVVKYIQAFAREGVKISAITVQNEPLASQTWESCEYSAEDEALLIRDYLVPAFNQNGLNDIKIIIWDHNKERVYDRSRDTLAVPGVKDKVWGIGFHWYSGGHYDALNAVRKMFPDKPLIETEFCKGLFTKGLTEGSHLDYAAEMLRNINHGMSASIDWNMILDLDGGPYHCRPGGCSAPILVDVEHDTIHYLSMYYEIAHFSRFMKRGAVHIGHSSYDETLEVTAVQNPDGTIVLVLLNIANAPKKANVRLENAIATFTVPAQSLTTALIS